ncbi:MAG: hypothetical protein KDE26_01985 [Bacteroidetes bacterium]|nr:hypothetical protein [Bacteroidota bacterium]
MFFLVKTYQPGQAHLRRNRPFEEIDLEVKKKKKGSIPLGKNIRLKGFILYPLIGIAVLAVLAMANTYQANLTVQDIKVQIHADEDYRLLNENMIEKILTEDDIREIRGVKMNTIQLEELEEILRANPTISEAEVYKTIQGNLNIEVVLRKPIARLINNEGEYLYMDAEGHKFPNTPLASSNVVLVRGDFDETIADTFTCNTIESALPVLNYIHKNEFWNGLISEVIIDQSGELILNPQVGDLEIHFGYPERIEDKFQNLRDFYRQVIKEVGWDHYRTVNLKIRGQIIAK